MARRLILVRHATYGPECGRRYIGRTDLPLDEVGERQARLVAGPLRACQAGRCLCSPLQRAVQTAAKIADACGLRAEVDPGLAEVDFGRWEGRTFAEIEESDPELVRQWAELGPDFAFPGGESAGDFFGRVKDAAARAAGQAAETVVVVSHGGVIRAMVCHFLGLPLRDYLLFEAEPASIAELRLHDGRGVLTRLNDTCHLLPGGAGGRVEG